MKKMILIFSLCITSIYSQTVTRKFGGVSAGDHKSYRVDKALSIYLFDYINKYRDSIGEGAFEWSETLYQDALDWNLELVRLKKYGHCTNIVNLGAEMINAYSTKTHELVNDDKMCKYIVDTWLASKHHYQGIISEKRIHDHETEISKKYKYLDVMPVSLMKYSAMSVVVKDMGHYYVYQVINRQL